MHTKKLRPFTRRAMDERLDRLRFRIDRGTGLDYQPLPWLGIERAARDDGVGSRWDAMWAFLTSSRIPASTMDIGCNVGYYPLQFADNGIPAIGVEANDKYCRLFDFAARSAHTARVGILKMTVSRETVPLLPAVDCTLFLAVWHHMVKAHGTQYANEMLAAIWMKTSEVMFFETGEREMPSSYRLPAALQANPRGYVEGMLAETCDAGTVQFLGEHKAFAPDGRSCERGLYAVRRSVICD